MRVMRRRCALLAAVALAAGCASPGFVAAALQRYGIEGAMAAPPGNAQ